jgi:hypothetical protein
MLRGGEAYGLPVLLPALKVPLATAEGTFARKTQRNIHFSLAFLSLIPTFGCRRRYFRSEQQKKNEYFFCYSLAYSYLWLSPKVLSLGTAKEKRVFLWLFSRLFVPLAVAEGTFARNSKRKTSISFAIPSLIRTFAVKMWNLNRIQT